MKTTWRGRSIAVGAGILILLLAEGFLRLLGFHAQPVETFPVAIDPFRRDGVVMITKKEFLESFRKISFPERPPSSVYRILCLGGSTTFGFPFAAETAWPAALERRIRALYPAQTVEVLNFGGNAYGSARTLGVLRGSFHYRPDLVVVALGDVEFVEDSYRTSVAVASSPRTFPHSLALAGALRRILPRRRAAPKIVDADSLDPAAFFFTPAPGSRTPPPTPARRDEVRARLEANLRAMIAACREQGVPLVLCTLPSNVRDWSPDAVGTQPADPLLRAPWEALISAAREAERAGRPSEAEGLLREALALWDQDPGLLFRYGSLLVRSGRPAEGKPFLLRARDGDSTPLRSVTLVNDTIRRVAQAETVPLVDLEQVFEAASPDNLVGDDLVFDHAHPTPKGQVLIARAIAGGLAEHEKTWGRPDPQAERRLADEEERLFSQPPRLTSNLAYVLGQVYLQKGKLDQAHEMYREALRLGYRQPGAEFGIAQIWYRRGDYAEALRAFEELAARHPDYEKAYPFLAFLYGRAGRREDAIRYYAQTLDHGERDPEAFADLALLLLEGKRFAEAGEILSRGLALHPTNRRLISLQGRLPEAAGKRPEGEAR